MIIIRYFLPISPFSDMFKLTVAQGGEVIYVSGLKPRDPATLMDYKGDLRGPEMNKAK